MLFTDKFHIASLEDERVCIVLLNDKLINIGSM